MQQRFEKKNIFHTNETFSPPPPLSSLPLPPLHHVILLSILSLLLSISPSFHPSVRLSILPFFTWLSQWISHIVGAALRLLPLQHRTAPLHVTPPSSPHPTFPRPPMHPTTPPSPDSNASDALKMKIILLGHRLSRLRKT